MNWFNSLKYVHYFDAYNSNQKKEKEEPKEKNIHFITFRNMCNIKLDFHSIDFFCCMIFIYLELISLLIDIT